MVVVHSSKTIMLFSVSFWNYPLFWKIVLNNVLVIVLFILFKCDFFPYISNSDIPAHSGIQNSYSSLTAQYFSAVSWGKRLPLEELLKNI